MGVVIRISYLSREKNRRADRLIYFLANDVEFDYFQKINNNSLNIVRMSPEERRRQRRELTTKSVNEFIMSTVIIESEEENGLYRVNPFTVEGLFHEIEVLNQEMKTCSCEDFKWNRIACKHMNLLRCLHTSIRLYQVFSPILLDQAINRTTSITKYRNEYVFI
ncbi:hypothetical protein BY458DRAFT_494702 [Sporodiniella umbellata]|nr:hypothetical protein BY458DRAFT_494702 [Sporodiniella umbellata]